MLLHPYFRKINSILPLLCSIDEDLVEILTVFVFSSLLNTYQINKLTKYRKKNKHHRSFSRRIQKLVKIKLIEIEPDPLKFKKKSELKRKEEYYRISEEGIFVLFYHLDILSRPSLFFYDYLDRHGLLANSNLSYVFAKYSKLIFQNYKDCKFFELFLSPWISINDIDKFDDNTIQKLHLYMRDCCISVKNFLSSLPIGIWKLEREICDSIDKQNSENSQEKVILYDLKNLKDIKSENSDDPFLSFIRKIFCIENSEMDITQANNSQLILDVESKKKIYLVFKDREQKLEIHLIGKDNISRLILETKSNREVGIPINPLSYFISQFDFDKLFYKLATSIVTTNVSKKDLNILSKKTQFMEITSKMMKKLQDNYNWKDDSERQFK